MRWTRTDHRRGHFAVEGLLQSADNDQGNLTALKAAVERLDQVTSFSDLMMDRAMEAMLRRQVLDTPFRRGIQVLERRRILLILAGGVLC